MGEVAEGTTASLETIKFECDEKLLKNIAFSLVTFLNSLSAP